MGELNTAQMSPVGELSLPGGRRGMEDEGVRQSEKLRPVFYGLKDGAGKSRECSAGSRKGELGGKDSKVPKQLIWSLGPDGDSGAGAKDVGSRPVLGEQPVTIPGSTHIQGCLGSYPSPMGDSHPLLISHTKKNRAL